jgi:hypothetical protein
MLDEKPVRARRQPGARRLLRSVLWAGLAAALPLGAARAAAAPDAHDRAAAAALDTRVAVFREIESAPFGASIARALRGCPPLERSIEAHKQNLGAAFSAVLSSGLDLSLPLTIDLADRYEAQLASLRTMLATIHPDAPLFARWRSTELRSIDLILAFANGGQPVSAFHVGTYLQGLSTVPARKMAAALAAFGTEVGISVGRYRALFPEFFSNANPAEALSGLAPSMEALFVAAGLSPGDAAVLSSSE